MSDSLLPHVMQAYVQAQGPLDNDRLYAAVAQSAQLSLDLFEEKVPVGRSQQPVNLLKRKIRWHQQTLRDANVITRLSDKRGVWFLSQPESKELNRISDGMCVLGFSTRLGIAIIGSCKDFFTGYNEPIHAIITSPPYPLARPRAYGNAPVSEYVDWICEMLEPVLTNLVDGGSIALNISNDIFMAKSPARSTYVERLVIALEDRFGLCLMDRLIWENPSKPPGPIAWASKERVQLNVAYEPIYWFTNNPDKVLSNNQRVLQPHSDSHAKLLARGGETRSANYCDGAYRIRPGSFGRQTAGRIPRNILKHSHMSTQHRAYRAACLAEGLPAHGAMMPYSLAKFLVEFLTDKGHRVADIFSGSFTMAQACEEAERNWVATERVLEYVKGGANRFRNAPGFDLAPVW